MYAELKKRFTQNVFKGEKNHRTALEKAYADMSRRATGHTQAMKTACISWLEDNAVFEQALACKTGNEFDQWHKKTCEALKDIHQDFGSIGRSQKVINMAFKYLACVDSTYDSVLPFCHMTLDGYTLNWYKEIGGCWVEWSKIDNYDAYFKIQQDIRNHLQAHREYRVVIHNTTTEVQILSAVPFEAEFVIWEGEIVKEKYNAVIKALEQYKCQGKDNDRWLIGEIVDEYLRAYNGD